MFRLIQNTGVSIMRTHIIPLILLAISAIVALANPHKVEILEQNQEIHQKAACEQGTK